MRKLFDSIENGLAFLWKRAEDTSNNNDQSLSVLRILYGLFIVFFRTPSFSWIGHVPQSLFLPPFFSLANLFNGFPDHFWLITIDIVLAILAICILLGVKARYAGILFALLHIIGSSFEFSFGKINHPILFLAFIFGLSFTNWGTCHALVPDKPVSQQVQRRALAVIAVLLCFGMFTAGIFKAIWWIDLDWNRGGFLSWFYRGYFSRDRQYLLAPFVLLIPPQAFEIFDYFAVIFELTPFIALLSGRKWWFLWLSTACLFHLGNTLLLNITFIAHVPVYISFFCFRPASSFLQNQEMRWKRWQVVLFTSAVAVAIATHHLFHLLTRNSLTSLGWYLGPIFGSELERALYESVLLWLVATCFTGAVVASSFGLKLHARQDR